MARNKIALMSTLLIFVLLSACNLYTEENISHEEFVFDEERVMRVKQAIDNLEVGDVSTFWFETEEFRFFLDEPSIERLYGLSRGFSVARKSPFEGRIIAIRPLDSFRRDMSILNFRIGSFPISEEFMDFMNEPGNFNNVLLEQGVESEILNVTIMTHPTQERIDSGTPPPGTRSVMAIWIQTTDGDYFLEHVPASLAGYTVATFGFNFYTLEEYRLKWGH